MHASVMLEVDSQGINANLVLKKMLTRITMPQYALLAY